MRNNGKIDKVDILNPAVIGDRWLLINYGELPTWPLFFLGRPMPNLPTPTSINGSLNFQIKGFSMKTLDLQLLSITRCFMQSTKGSCIMIILAFVSCLLQFFLSPQTVTARSIKCALGSHCAWPRSPENRLLPGALWMGFAWPLPSVTGFTVV